MRAVDRIGGQPRINHHIDVLAGGRLVSLPQPALQTEPAALHGDAGGGIGLRQLDGDPSHIMGQDGIIRGQGDRPLQRLGIDQLRIPPQPAEAVVDVDVDREVAHACRRSHTDPSGGTVTFARAGK